MALLAISAACGGSSPAPGATPAITAAGLIPDLTGLGFAMGQSERDPAAQPGQDAHRALFQQAAAPQMGARVDVTVLKDVTAATAQWETVSQALRNPPPDLFGASSSQKDTTATNVGDQSRAYITAKPDSSGTQVWTDIYRFGRAVAIVQVLSRSEPDAQKARVAIAEKILAKAK